MKLYELACACYGYANFTDFDKTYRDFLDKTKPCLDVHNTEHKGALLEWLNKWGCRIKDTFHPEIKGKLESWYDDNRSLLPSPNTNLLKILDSELERIVESYNTLQTIPHIGPTCASKILFALRKDVFPPWDVAMRKKWKYNGSAKSYKAFLIATKKQLCELDTECARYRILLSKLPSELARPQSSLVKLIDEYNWVTITKNVMPPTTDTLQKWYLWEKQTQ
ncbi:MAG: hypothetical protein V1932_01710 [Chloroflexota bacterium]